MGFVQFMNTVAGRGVRVADGLALIIGALLAGGTAGWVVAVVGIVPLGTGVANVCLFAPLFHAPSAVAPGRYDPQTASPVFVFVPPVEVTLDSAPQSPRT